MIPLRQLTRRLDGLDVEIEEMLRAARIPGAALAIVAGEKTIFAKGFGSRDLAKHLPVIANTVYPIASTTKPMNATLLSMLVEEGTLEWDAPIVRYMPEFRLQDEIISTRVTLRDLVTMRTGVPRHDWVWVGDRSSRADLAKRMAHLMPSADFRQRFQYCNLSVVLTGHVAERVTGKSWESLVRTRLFAPLRMRRTGCGRPDHDNVTRSYHENVRRRLVTSRVISCESTGPSGGSIHSTVVDMARWLSFNLTEGKSKLLTQIHAPQVVIGERPLAALPADGAYALGWLVDHHQGHKRLSHGGNLHDIHSSVMFFPKLQLGMVAFTNFGAPQMAEFINQLAFDRLTGSPRRPEFEQRVAAYEKKMAVALERRRSALPCGKPPQARSLKKFIGRYLNAGYGEIRIERRGRGLILLRGVLRLPLRHYTNGTWISEQQDFWPVHLPHPLDREHALRFHSAANGEIQALSIPFESETLPIRFDRVSSLELECEGRRQRRA